MLNYRKIITPTGDECLIDENDYFRVNMFSWHTMTQKRNYSTLKYLARTEKRNKIQRTILLHRFIMKTSPEFEYHHKNGNTLDNRKNNLVNISHSEHKRLHPSHPYTKWKLEHPDKLKCPKCKEIKNKKLFTKHGAYCLMCHNINGSTWRKNNIEKARAADKKYRNKITKQKYGKV
jgi:rubredoxin